MRWLLLIALACLPGCVVFHDTEGVSIHDDQLEEVVPGLTSRDELLALLGPPTGVFQVRPFDVIFKQDQYEPPARDVRLDEDVLVWQQVTIEGKVLMLPVLFWWVSTQIWSRTVMVILEDDLVLEVSMRDDEP